MTTPVGSVPGPSPLTATGRTYLVRGGDTLSAIATREGISLSELLRANPQITDPNRIQVGQLLKLPDRRPPAPLSIVAAAEYDGSNLEELRRRGLVSEKLTDDERARLMYLAHHEGVEGADKILRDTLTDGEARRLLNRNLSDETKRAALVEEHGGEAAAYKAWLNAYIQANIRPERFR